jgi:hypothetical protein
MSRALSQRASQKPSRPASKATAMRLIRCPAFAASSRHRCSNFSNALSSTASFCEQWLADRDEERRREAALIARHGDGYTKEQRRTFFDEWPSEDPDLEKWTPINDELFSVGKKIMEQQPRTMADIVLQARATAMMNNELWLHDGGTVFGWGTDLRMLTDAVASFSGQELLPGLPVLPPEVALREAVVESVDDSAEEPEEEPVKDDPIFAAIERQKATAAAWGSHDGDADPRRDKRLHAADTKALRALLTTRPTTLEGCAAVLRYIGEYGDRNNCGLLHDFIDPLGSAGASFMPMLAAMLESVAAASVRNASR